MRNERHVKEPLSAYIILTDDAHQVSSRKVALDVNSGLLLSLDGARLAVASCMIRANT